MPGVLRLTAKIFLQHKRHAPECLDRGVKYTEHMIPGSDGATLQRMNLSLTIGNLLPMLDACKARCLNSTAKRSNAETGPF